MKPHHLEAQIREAFQYRKKVLTLEYLVVDSDCIECREAFAGYSWKDLEPVQAVKGFDCIDFFEPEDAFEVIAAWLIASLRFPTENVAYWTISNLRDNYEAYAKMACPAERQAIVKFLCNSRDATSDPGLELIEGLKLWGLNV